ncbi:MAG: hypothetical protein CMH30_06915 [Micavibrio sp.]|nr:hypothetical protein [Micavibrio sp.]|tara:strand:+ start:5361 stop:6053 length:693 start_codon:yes stop_codon:yes gene_type:complete
MELTGLPTLLFAILILMLKPGAVMLTSMSLAMEGRWRSIVAFWGGFLTLHTCSYYFFLTTLSALPQGYGIIFIFMKAIASILFIVLGVKGLESHYAKDVQSSEALEKKINKKNYLHTFMMGGFLQISNPYDYVFILTVIPSVLGKTSFTFMEITVLNFLVISMGVFINALYIIPILKYREKFLSPEILKNIKKYTSIMLILIGLYIFSTMIFRGAMVEADMLSSLFTHLS